MILDPNGKIPVDVNIGGGQFCSPIHIAVAQLEVKIINRLIIRKVDVNAIDLSTGDQPLHLLMTVYSKNIIAARNILNFLVEAGADLNAKNHD